MEQSGNRRVFFSNGRLGGGINTPAVFYLECISWHYWKEKWLMQCQSVVSSLGHTTVGAGSRFLPEIPGLTMITGSVGFGVMGQNYRREKLRRMMYDSSQ